MWGGAGERFVVYRLPNGQDFASDSIEDSLAVPPAAGAYRAKIALHNDLDEALDGEEAISAQAFGGEATAVVVTSGVEIAVESLLAVADVETDFVAAALREAGATHGRRRERRARLHDLPSDHHTKIHSANPLERVNKEIKRRTNVVGIFPNEAALVRLVGAILIEQNDERAVARKYMTLETIAPLGDPADVTPPAIAAA